MAFSLVTNTNKKILDCCLALQLRIYRMIPRVFVLNWLTRKKRLNPQVKVHLEKLDHAWKLGNITKKLISLYMPCHFTLSEIDLTRVFCVEFTCSTRGFPPGTPVFSSMTWIRLINYFKMTHRCKLLRGEYCFGCNEPLQVKL